MSNPFEALNVSDDDEPVFNKTQEQKPKRTHQDRKAQKQQKIQEAKIASSAPVVTESLPERVKQNAKVIRHNRGLPTPVAKQLGEGHFHDRRSGTGRTDKPRKEGGGKGNVGNIKDELNQDKYIKETTQEGQEAAEGENVEAKPEEPQPLTLDEYYKSKGLEVTNTYEGKGPAKKGEINAEWIKKEKLTLLQTKQDKKNNERAGQNVVKVTETRVGLDQNLEKLGFGQKPAAKRTEEKREARGRHHKGKVINEEEFPAL